MATTAQPSLFNRFIPQKRNARLSFAGKLLVHLGAIVPLIWLYIQWYTYALIDELNEMTLFTGKGGLILLLVMMAVTPLITVTGWSWLAPLRKWLGLYAFFYITIHLLIFIVPMADLDAVFGRILFKQRYALAGLSAWLIMLPLAITSNKYSQKRLKRNWKKLHKWVYASGVLAIIHYFWLVKVGNYKDPVLFGTILAVLFVLRLPTVRKSITTFRRNLKRKNAKA